MSLRLNVVYTALKPTERRERRARSGGPPGHAQPVDSARGSARAVLARRRLVGIVRRARPRRAGTEVFVTSSCKTGPWHRTAWPTGTCTDNQRVHTTTQTASMALGPRLGVRVSEPRANADANGGGSDRAEPSQTAAASSFSVRSSTGSSSSVDETKPSVDTSTFSAIFSRSLVKRTCLRSLFACQRAFF